MPRAFKIFASHGGAVAHRLLDARARLVGRFVDAYIAEFGRRGLQDPQRYRELQAMIGREALLVMVGRVQLELPRLLSRVGRSGEQLQALEPFFRELLAALARGLHWSQADADEFRRDLDFHAHAAGAAHSTAPTKRADPSSVFADRCALLLDPSMLDQARLAAARFQDEIESETEKLLRSVLQRRR